MKMTPEEYLKDRVENQINWYDRKSIRNKEWFCFLQIIVLAMSGAVPVVSMLSIVFEDIMKSICSAVKPKTRTPISNSMIGLLKSPLTARELSTFDVVSGNVSGSVQSQLFMFSKKQPTVNGSIGE